EDPGVDGFDHLGQLAALRLDVVELALEEGVSLAEGGVLLEGEGVDGAHEAQLALELAHPVGRAGARRKLRARGDDGHVGLALELATYGVDSGLQAHPGLGLLELAPPGSLPYLLQVSLRRGALASDLLEALP